MNFLNRKLVYPYEYFNSFGDNQKLINNLKKEYVFGKLKKFCPDDGKIGRTKQKIKNFVNRNIRN